MKLRLTCTSCGTTFGVEARHAGKTGRCPNPACGAPIRVPRTVGGGPGEAGDRRPRPPRVAPRPPVAPERGTRAPAARRGHRPAPLPYLAAAGVFAVVVGFVALRDLHVPSRFGRPEAVTAPSTGLLLAAEPVVASIPSAPPEDPAFKETLVPFLNTYCVECHGPETAEADLNFATFDSVKSLQADRKKWNQILGMVRIGVMPPADHDNQPPAEVKKIVVDWLDQTLNYVDCRIVDDPGHVTIRRLNRVEYDNTIRDLVGVDFKPAADFPTDDVGNGFDNQGDVLSLPPLLMEKYLDAAEQVTDQAIVSDVESLLTKRKNGGELASTGEVSRRFDFQPGEYVLRAGVRADQAGTELAKAELRFDDKPVEVVEVQGQDAQNVLQVVVNVDQPGEKRFGVAFLNDFYDPNASDPRQRDRNLRIDWLEVQGPKGATPELPEPHRRIVFTAPGDGKSVRQAAEEVMTRFATRAYRRPADPVEVNRLASLVEMAVGQGESFEKAVAYGVQAALVSPQFLFRVEGEGTPGADGKAALGDYELATRLSYFLWSSMPDDELFDLAGKGELSKPEVASAQVKRMLADPKAEALVVNFFGQWLNLRILDEADPDSREFPWWNSQLQAAMRKETELFCSAIVKEDRSVLDVLDADFTFVNPRLAELYGVKWNDEDPRELYYNYRGNKNDGDYRGNRRSGHYQHEDEFVRVSLPPERRGVLTQASVLTLTSNPTDTSPVRRGKWILENILGTPPPPAPPGVPSFDEAKKAKPDATLREQLELHRSDPGCASCHSVMDPLGLGFENFDVIGKWRDKDGRLDIDPSGKLEDGQAFKGAVELIAILKGRDEQIARHFIEKLMTYALGRGLEPYDRCAVDEVLEAAKKDDYRFSAVVTSIVGSDPFRLRRGDGGRP